MSKVKIIIKAIISAINGKKTNASMIAIIVNRAIQVIFPDMISKEIHNLIEDTAIGLGGVGLGHKAIKAKVSDNIKKANQK